MEQKLSGRLVDRVARLRDEAMALSEEGQAFPAIWRNAVRVLACVRMMEVDLGLGFDPEEPIPSSGKIGE